MSIYLSQKIKTPIIYNNADLIDISYKINLGNIYIYIRRKVFTIYS